MKKMKVSDVLSFIDDSETVAVQIYAYGIIYGSSWEDGMRTAKDCKERINYTCKNANVFEIATGITMENKPMVIIRGELVS